LLTSVFKENLSPTPKSYRAGETNGDIRSEKSEPRNIKVGGFQGGVGADKGTSCSIMVEGSKTRGSVANGLSGQKACRRRKTGRKSNPEKNPPWRSAASSSKKS